MEAEYEPSPAEIMAEFDPAEDPFEGAPLIEEEDSRKATTIEGFPPEVRQDVEGLLWLGYLEDDFEFCGHHFVIRTLRGDEELLASLISKEWIDSLGQTRAWAWAQIALALISIDFDDDFCPAAGPDPRAYARARFNYVTSRWFWPVADHIFGKYAALQDRQSEALKRIEDLSQGSLPTSPPSVGSSIEKGDSEESPEILDYLDPPDSIESKPDSSVT